MSSEYILVMLYTIYLLYLSPLPLSNCGMSYLVGSHWRDYFDVVIVQARKPKFFTDESRPIRLYDEKTRSHLWDRVFKLEKGKIYYEVPVAVAVVAVSK